MMTSSKEQALSKVMEKTEGYELVVGLGKWDHPLKDSPCYRIINRMTGVCEAEISSYPYALRTLHDMQHLLEKVMADPEGLSGEPLPGDDDDDNFPPVFN